MGIAYEDVFNLDELSFETIIGALNKYFANGKHDTSFIEVRKNGVVYRVSADDLIAWLRKKHGIFYYPGMEAKYAKAEKRIPPFSERMKNDGALRALKKLHKQVTGIKVSDTFDSPTLIASAIETDFAVLKQDLKNALEAKESFFETKGKLSYRKELMEYITKTEKKHGICFSDLHDDEEFRPERIFDDLLDKATRDEHILKDLYRDILHKQPDGLSNEDIATKIIDKTLEMKERLDHKEAKVVGEIRVKQCEEELLDYIYKEYEGRIRKDKNNIRYSPSSVRNTIKKIISDYARSITRVEILETRIKTIFDKCKSKYTVDEYISDDPTISFMIDCIGTWLHSGTTRDHIKILAESRAEIKNSDINKLIRDYCAKNDIIPPSPYFSDKACVEYLFSVVDLEREHRAAVGKQMVNDYKKDIMDYIRQEASLNGFNLPEKVDGEPLTIERVFHDLLELMRIRGEELRILKSKCDRLNEIIGELNTLNDEIKG